MTQIQECRGGCKGTHPTICEQEGCAIVQGEHRRAKKEAKMKTPEYRRGYQAGYKAAKTGSELPLDMAGKLSHSL